ncbi:MAG: Restriction endonuclease BglII [Edaphobacter sp.]|nr:Restriction endonuclease BglII [Edaphobacter sp.]
MSVGLLPPVVFEKFEVAETHHAASILYTDFRAEWDDLVGMLSSFILRQSDVLTPGGRKSPISLGIDRYFYNRQWVEKDFKIKVSADGETTLAPTHQVDYFRNRVAIETEWNNKDPFYDRDLTTFRLLFELNVLSVGVIVTRATELQDIFVALGRGTSFGNSTTHMGKLVPKLNNRASGGCPVLAFGIKKTAYDIAS